MMLPVSRRSTRFCEAPPNDWCCTEVDGMKRRWMVVGFIVGIGILLPGGRVQALITRLIPLRETLTNELIFLGKVEKVYPDKPALVLKVDEQLKGKAPFTRLPISLKGDSEAKKYNHTAQLQKRLAAQMPVILFVNKRNENLYIAFAFTNGTWFQLKGRKNDANISWAFTHCEPYLRRTFAGTTAELRQIIVDGLSGKKKPPEPNAKEKPGLGPEIQSEKKSERGGSTAGPLFAVIPTLGLGGPLAVLALLFPGLFGGALLVLRSWAALLAVAGVNSTLLLLSVWFPRLLRGTYLETGLGLWYTMLLITLAGALWAWRSQHRKQWTGQAAATGPTRSERVILWISSIAFLIAFLLVYLLGELSAEDPSWKLLLVFTIGFWVGTLYLVGNRLLRQRRPAPYPPLPAHLIVLWGMIFASTVLAAAWPAAPVSVTADLSAAQKGVARLAWQVVLPRGGFVVSPPLVHGDRVYVAAAHKQGGADTFGVLYCLNAATGKQIWQFDNDGEMKQVFSAPTVVDGKLFIGEGFHQDRDCRMYCLEAGSGKKVWEFATESHTESSPYVAGGKVYFGAGDDGVYCVDVQTGKKVWQYPGENGDTIPTSLPRGAKGPLSKKPLKLHVDASPVVAGGRLYVGSGIDRDSPGHAPAVFCLDAGTGRKIWLLPLLDDDLAAWGSPVTDGDQVFFGLGNGDILSDASNPTGALLCVNTRTGREQWRFPIDNSILRKPALDETSVYFGCRNGTCYCVDRRDGKLRWEQKTGSPIVASPTLFRCAHCGTNRLYVVGTGGQVQCLSPETGLALWKMSHGESTFLSSTPCVAGVQTSKGDRRRIYFGAGLANREVAALICLEER
jgi:outer membrane protein assembly factor BamB